MSALILSRNEAYHKWTAPIESGTECFFVRQFVWWSSVSRGIEPIALKKSLVARKQPWEVPMQWRAAGRDGPEKLKSALKSHHGGT